MKIESTMEQMRKITLLALFSLSMAAVAQAQCGFNLSNITTQVTCFGGNTGAIDLNVSGGPAPFSYFWSTNNTTEDLMNIPAGTYTVTVSDALACTTTLEVTVTQPAAIQVNAADGTLNCYTPTIQIPVSLSGGLVAPYSWATNFGNGGGSGTQFNIGPILTPGSYAVTVVDANGCTASDGFTVDQDVVTPVASAGPDKILTCVNPDVQLDGSGSTVGAAIAYQWTTVGGSITSGTNLLTPTVSSPGTYILTVINTQNGCAATDQVLVTANWDPPIISLAAQTGLPCGGGNVTLVTSSTSGVAYSWSGPNSFASNVQSPVVNQPGVYTVVATSLNGCTSVAQSIVFPGPAIPLQNFAVTNLPCTPGIFGAINMTIDFGTGPYIYAWSNGEITEDIANLTAGTYTIITTDATGCAYHAEVLVGQASSNIVINHTVNNVTCLGSLNGSINLTVAGGTAPYTYQWLGPQGYNSTVEDPASIPAGNYSVTVTDVSGCTQTKLIVVGSPNLLDISPFSVVITPPDCNGGPTGAIDITVQGGVVPYSYDWSNDGPETPDNDAQDLINIGPGFYTVTVTDGNGCTLASTPFSLQSPATLQLSAVVIPETCGGGNNGAIDLTATGGLGGGYTFQWSTSSTTADINNLNAGTYTVTVTQSNGCSKTYSATVYQGGTVPLTDFTVIQASCEITATDGAITLNNLPAQGQAPFTFQWAGPSLFTSTSQNLIGLESGIYSLTATDAQGCEFRAAVLVDKAPGDLTLDFLVGTPGCFTGTIDLTVTGGQPPYDYIWSNGISQEDIEYSISGPYAVTVTDANGCSKSATVTITDPAGLELSANVVPPGCLGNGSDGAIDLTVTNGSGQYDFTWNGAPGPEDLSSLAPGLYCVVVTDITNGCTAQQCYNVPSPFQMAATVSTDDPPTCFGFADGSTVVAVTNPGVGPYNWVMTGASPQSGTAQTLPFTITGLVAGNFCVTVTNANGCSASACAVLFTPPAVVASIEELSNTCNASVLRANVNGGTAPLSYSWEGPVSIAAISPIINAPLSGLYQVFVQDANGCGDFANITVALANGGNCGYVNGSVILDGNKNCVPEINEPGLSGWLVRAEGLDTLYGVTDANGKFLVGVPLGSYAIAVLPPNNLWTVCTGALTANVSAPNDTIFGGDIPVKREVDCPAMTVSLAVSQLRRCFSNNYYYVNYGNEGTAEALGAYVEVTLDPFLTLVSATVSWQNVGNNTYRFFLGNVGVGGYGSFRITVSVSCDAVLGQTHCTEAQIFPNALCNTDIQWSGADLEVSSQCNTDSLHFTIKNVGSGTMTTIKNYIVVEDAVMVMSAPLPLLGVGESVDLAFPANGSTWRVEVEQDEFHPYPQPASLSVEGCTTSSSFSTGFINQYSVDDAPPTEDIICRANIGSYDPNDKRGFPEGYSAAHYVNAGAEIEYLIRFQNTGTDTAFTVRVVDTLSSWLDPATVKFGASSHPYRYDLCGEGIVHFIFENIMLPDSNVNEEASHGFATFTVKARPEAPLETLVENSAAIYFDYNEPVITNTTNHRLGKNFISVGLWQPHIPAAAVTATPNPFSEETELTVKGLVNFKDLELQVYDYQGTVLKTLHSDNAIFHIRKGDWPTGIYFFKITQQDKIIGVGKLSVQ